MQVPEAVPAADRSVVNVADGGTRGTLIVRYEHY